MDTYDQVNRELWRKAEGIAEDQVVYLESRGFTVGEMLDTILAPRTTPLTRRACVAQFAIAWVRLRT